MESFLTFVAIAVVVWFVAAVCKLAQAHKTIYEQKKTIDDLKYNEKKLETQQELMTKGNDVLNERLTVAKKALINMGCFQTADGEWACPRAGAPVEDHNETE